MEKINLMIVDDRDINRDLLKLLLGSNDNINIVAEASDGKEAINKVDNFNIDIVIMDINMPNMNGIDATKKLKEIKPDIKILFNSFHEDVKYIKQVINAGASGYIKKGESNNSYIKAIETIKNDGIYLSDEINESVYKDVFKSMKYNRSIKCF